MPAKRKSPVRRASGSGAPDPSAHLARVKRIKGQIEGLQRMLEHRRSAAEILVQVGAARAALRSLETAIVREQAGHFLRHPPRGSAAAAERDALWSLFQRLSS